MADWQRGEVLTSRCHGSNISGWKQTENVTEKLNSSCFKLHCSYSVSFNLSNVSEIFWGLNPKDPYLSFCVVFTFFIKQAREIKKFHVAVVQGRLRNVLKSVMQVQSSCFTKINVLLFCRSRCRHPCRCLSPLLLWSRNFATLVTWRHTYTRYFVLSQ